MKDIYIYARREGISNTNNYKIRIDVNDTTEVFHQTYTGGVKLFKFASHFSGMIWQKDVGVGFEQQWCENVHGNGNCFPTGLDVDNSGNIYITGNIIIEHNMNDGFFDTTCYNYLIIDNNNPSHKIKIDAGERGTGFIIKYDNNGNVQWVNQGYSKRIIYDDDGTYANGSYYDYVRIGDDNNIYVLRECSLNFWYNNSNFFFDDTIPMRRYSDTAECGGGLFFVKYNNQTGRYISHGIIPSISVRSEQSIMTIEPTTYSVIKSFDVKNNQIFATFKYFAKHKLLAPDTIYNPDIWEDL